MLAEKADGLEVQASTFSWPSVFILDFIKRQTCFIKLMAMVKGLLELYKFSLGRGNLYPCRILILF